MSETPPPTDAIYDHEEFPRMVAYAFWLLLAPAFRPAKHDDGAMTEWGMNLLTMEGGTLFKSLVACGQVAVLHHPNDPGRAVVQVLDGPGMLRAFARMARAANAELASILARTPGAA